jgi:hypothetical protein
VSRTIYECAVRWFDLVKGEGGNRIWTETSERAACKETRAEVQRLYRDGWETSGSVRQMSDEPNVYGYVDVAAWRNVDGRTVRVES